MNSALDKIISAMANSQVHQYATPGLTSSLVGGNGCGTLRLFESDRDTREWITPHSHRFDFACLVLAGEVENILFVRGYGPRLNRFAEGKLRPVSGGLGHYEVVRIGDWAGYGEVSTTYKAGDIYSMQAKEIHTIRFSRGARVLFFEGPNISTESVFLEPYSNGKVVETFRTQPWMFERAPLATTTLAEAAEET